MANTIDQLSNLINKSAQNTNSLQEFYWAVYDNLDLKIRQHFTKKLAGEFYVKFKEEGRSFDPEAVKRLIVS